MKQDEYGAALETTLRAAEEPMTAAELKEAVGCSRQRVYVWLQANELHLRQVSKDRNGAARYAWSDGVEAAMDDVFRVKSFFADHGQITLVLVGPDGATYHARPAQG